MGCEGELLGTPWQCRNRHIVVGNKHYGRLSALAKGAPAHLLAVAHRLWLGQNDVLLANDATMMLDKLTRLAVVVVVHRATSVIVEGGVCLRQLHGVAYAWQHNTWTIGRYGALQLYRTILIYGVYLVGGKL